MTAKYDIAVTGITLTHVVEFCDKLVEKRKDIELTNEQRQAIEKIREAEKEFNSAFCL